MPAAWCMGWALAFAQGDAAAKPAPDAGKAPPPVAAPEAKAPAAAKAEAPGAKAEIAPPPAEGNIFGSMLPFAIMLAAAYFLLILPNQRNDKKRKELLNAIKKDDTVETSFGVIGTVANFDDVFVTLKLDDKRDATMKIRRTAIAAITKSKGG